MDDESWKKSFEVKYQHFSMEARDAAQGWSCCAIGCRLQKERPELNIRSINMKKLLTPKAHRLGLKFFDHVRDNNVEKAEKTYNQIQELDNIFRVDGKQYFPWDRFI